MADKRVVVVTGASRGLGKEIALAFASKDVSLVLAARTLSELNQTAKEVEKRGAHTLVVKTDVRSVSDCTNLVKKTLERFSRIDILVNNAGVFCKKPFDETVE
ncbi:MAG: SDR family NAD(P)-dependent oxidoreductase, partial [Candidatus Diapherotrites archaeon]|nr:SDR family NAD(P)-dependent oxidoreductase [Candidatus Diapherotrites archaeon]